MKRAHEWADETGAALVSLATAKDNTKAKALYEDLGFPSTMNSIIIICRFKS